MIKYLEIKDRAITMWPDFWRKVLDILDLLVFAAIFGWSVINFLDYYNEGDKFMAAVSVVNALLMAAIIQQQKSVFRQPSTVRDDHCNKLADESLNIKQGVDQVTEKEESQSDNSDVVKSFSYTLSHRGAREKHAAGTIEDAVKGAYSALASGDSWPLLISENGSAIWESAGPMNTRDSLEAFAASNGVDLQST
jgi:hypothetical protein